MEAFEHYCLPRRTETLLSLLGAPIAIAFDMLLASGLRCSSKRMCTQYEECERIHCELQLVASPEH